MNLKLKKILITTGIILLIPLFGVLFVDGWNWGVGDFVFATFFFIFAGITYQLSTRNVKSKNRRIAIGLALFLIFAFIWATLATGD